MSELVHYEVRDRVAIITIDNPPVNALSPGVPEGISDAVARAGDDPAADAIVLIGAGTTFIAGADINVFNTLKTREQSLERSEAVHARLLRIEDTPKPIVAAIHGHALGGGLEFAMACHYRVAVRRRQGRPARSAARHHPWRRRHAAPAAPLRRRAGARNVHRRQAARRGTRGEGRHHRCGRGRQSARGRHGVRARPCRRRRSPQGPRPAGQDRRPRRRTGRLPGHPGGPGQDRTRCARAVCRRRRHRSGADDGFLRRLDARTRALRRLRALDRIARLASSVLRRARGRQDSRRAEGHAGERDSARRSHRRRHDGRRHRHVATPTSAFRCC